MLDRTNSHLESLSQAKSKGRMPTRLRITTKPVVVHSKDEDLKIKWAQACRQGKLLLIQVLLDHLEKVIKETRNTLRDISGHTNKTFKTANADTIKENMEEALRMANLERKQRNKNWKKRKLEAGPSSRPAKKPSHSLSR